jgi:intraflagellar transport protein 81
MTEISQIVDRLNEPPFNRDLRLVEFDEKSPLELIAVLNDVFAAVDPQQSTADARDEPEDARASRLMGFLQMLKFEVPPQQAEAFAAGLGSGDKGAVYPVLHWVLQRLPQLQKRAYLARYLMPLSIPVEFLQDPALVDALEAYKELQGDFKGTHKAVDSLRKSDLRPGELRSEITQLEDEKRQLKEKIARVQRAAAEEPGFAEMFEVTSRLRRAQEEEGRLGERAREQRSLLGQVALLLLLFALVIISAICVFVCSGFVTMFVRSDV